MPANDAQTVQVEASWRWVAMGAHVHIGSDLETSRRLPLHGQPASRGLPVEKLGLMTWLSSPELTGKPVH